MAENPNVSEDRYRRDASDYFATAIEQVYGDDVALELVKIQPPWRPCWQITVAEQAESSVRAVWEKADDLRRWFFVEKDVLIAFYVVKEGEGG